jgi:hypothetical protein
MRQYVAFVCILAAVVGGAGIVRAQVSSDIVEDIIQRTVHLSILVQTEDKRIRIVGGCSGSFITPQGLILTASHCVRSTRDVAELKIRKGELHNPEGVVLVSLNVAGTVNPVPMMLARYVADSVPLDIGLVKVDRVLGSDGARPLPRDFVVPTVPLGNSDSVRHGEPVVAVGFPGVGGDSVSANQGTVAGFIADDQNRRSWLKIDAAGAGPGSSGGPVVNARGEQVGIISHGFVDAPQAARSVRAALTNRVPENWRQGSGPPRQPANTGSSPSGQPAPAAESAAAIVGKVVDAATGAPISGAGIFVFREGVNPRTATRDDILAGAVTDANGLFQTQPVKRGTSYPVVILASGYTPILATLEVPPTGRDVIDIGVVEVQR